MARKPFIYQINTRVWLTEISKRHHQEITLQNVPDAVIDELASFPFTHVWMMGIWTRSEGVRSSAMNYKHEYLPVLPDLKDDDVIGSAYAIGEYEVDPAAGGRSGLAKFRAQLARHGIKLILDYVPNHLAYDHPDIARKPELFIRATAREAKQKQGMFFPTRDMWGRELYVAHGRDPYFPSWIDTAQLNAFSPAMRQYTIEKLLDIASQCDGVRCDMAMLLMNEIFNRTWGWAVEEPMPEKDFWVEIIPAIREQHPEFLFIAEVYWNLDYELQQQGFDFTYDKVLYDRMHNADVNEMRHHLLADVNFLSRTVHFIENHDEPRAASVFGVEKSMPAVAMAATVPGAVLLHDGQFVGRKVKLPVQINRQPEEDHHPDLMAYYRKLLREVTAPIYSDGEWRVLHAYDAPVLAYGYHLRDDYRVMVVNMSNQDYHAVIDLTPWGYEFIGRDIMSSARSHTENGYMPTYVPAMTTQIYRVRPITPTPILPHKQNKGKTGRLRSQ